MEEVFRDVKAKEKDPEVLREMEKALANSCREQTYVKNKVRPIRGLSCMMIVMKDKNFFIFL